MNLQRAVRYSAKRWLFIASTSAACVGTALLAAEPVVTVKGVTVEVSSVQQLDEGQQIPQKSSNKSVSMWCQAVDGGHTINITASNTDNVNHNCSSTCYTRDNNGNNGYVSATGTVPAHANHVVFGSSFDANRTRIVSSPGSFNCP